MRTMPQRINNYSELATTTHRKEVLEIIESAYHAIDTELALKENIKLNKHLLEINGTSYNLDAYEKIYVIGFGKVASTAAATIDNILEHRIEAGAVAGIKKFPTKQVTTYVCSHPLASDINLQAAEEIEALAHKVTEDDLVLVIVGGGGSSLLCSHENELIQGTKLYQEFLNTGGTIREMNIVRKHISAFKGGGLAKLLYPARVVNLIFSDVPGDDLESIASGPTMYDATSVEDAQAILDKYTLTGYKLNETPKDQRYFKNVDNHLMVSNTLALSCMKETAQSFGYKVVIAGDDLYLNVEETIHRLQSLAEPNTVVIAGGETRFIIPENCEGEGGRSDMLTLSMLKHLHGNQVFAAFASDGHDNTEAAGGIVDKRDQQKLPTLEMDVEHNMVCFNSFPVMKALNSLIFTGLIESNISDLMILLTPKNT